MGFINKIIKSHSKKDDYLFNELKSILGFSPRKISIYHKAFVHRSIKETTELGFPKNYERLEFLGDAVLGAVIASYLFKKVPSGNEGYLTQMRSKIVSREHLNEIGTDLDLIRLVKSNVSKSKFGENINGNIFESLIGAIYLDRGYKYSKKFIYKSVIKPYVNIPMLEGKITSYKSLFIEWCQKEKREFDYDVFDDSGKNAVKHFSVKLSLDNKVIAKGRSTSKKKAEEIASKRAYFAFQKEISNG